jgi:hypothetical protein
MLLADGSPCGAAPRGAAVSQTALNLGEPILFAAEHMMASAAQILAKPHQLLVKKPKEFQRQLRYLTSIERAHFRVLDKLTELQKERRAAEEAAALEKAWLAQLEVEQQTAESKTNPTIWVRFENPAMCHKTVGRHLEATA